ncbi:MAG: hypothetical protein RL705_1742, partial [Bacteroidota bacterium]
NSLTITGLILDMGETNIYYIYPKPNIYLLIKLILILTTPYKSIVFIPLKVVNIN